MTGFNACEMERVIHDIEFENQKYVKEIEKERQEIENLQHEYEALTREINNEEQITPKLDEAIKNYHQQFIHNRNNISNLKKTLDVLNEYRGALIGRLKNLIKDDEQDRGDRKGLFIHFENVWKGHQKCYDSIFMVESMDQKKENVEIAKEAYTKAYSSKTNVQEQLENFNFKSDLDFKPYTDVDQFLITLAEIYAQYKKTETSLKAVVNTYSTLCVEIKKVEDALSNKEKICEVKNRKAPQHNLEKLYTSDKEQNVKQTALQEGKLPPRLSLQIAKENQYKAAQQIKPPNVPCLILPNKTGTSKMILPKFGIAASYPKQHQTIPARCTYDKQIERKPAQLDMCKLKVQMSAESRNTDDNTLTFNTSSSYGEGEGIKDNFNFSNIGTSLEGSSNNLFTMFGEDTAAGKNNNEDFNFNFKESRSTLNSTSSPSSFNFF